MPGQGRLGDKANISADAHGCPGCPHPGTGPAVQGSPNVFVNGRPALRADDIGIHAVCCGTNMWRAQQGATTVFINGKAAFRAQDPTQHCGGQGKLIEGSSDVIVGDAGGAGAAGGGSSSSGGSASSASSSSSGSSSASTSSSVAPSSSSGPAAENTSPASTAAPEDATAKPLAPAAGSKSKPEDELTWIEIRLVGEDGSPVPGERFVLVPSKGEKRTGFTDADGKARLYAVEPGSCTLSFPEMDGDAWEPADD